MLDIDFHNYAGVENKLSDYQLLISKQNFSV